MIDLFLHAGTKFALEQWLDARGVGDSYQDTDAESPTFGDWFYRHTDQNSTFIWWRHPSGKLESSIDATDPENPVTSFFNGFYGILRFRSFDDMNTQIGDWVRTSTAVSILESFAGYGGEGITIIAPEDVQAHLDAEGIPGHEFLGGMAWTDPRVWFLGPVMTGAVRDFDGVSWRSLQDFNHFNMNRMSSNIGHECAIDLLREHIEDVAGRDHIKKPCFKIDDLKQAFEIGVQCGRHDAVIDYARHIKSRFFVE